MLGRDDNMSERLHVRAYALHTQTCETHMAWSRSIKEIGCHPADILAPKKKNRGTHDMFLWIKERQ